jgi:hypothetical protein
MGCIRQSAGGAGAKQMRRRRRIHANFLQGLPIAVLSFFKGFERTASGFVTPKPG